MGRRRGYILVLLVTLWATLPALASLCPRQIPPCCRGMREMCCMSSSAPVLNTCCHMQMPQAVVSPSAVVNSTDHAWHAVSFAVVAQAPAEEIVRVAVARVEFASSPPIVASHTTSILRI
jgi:hypothetical protein